MMIDIRTTPSDFYELIQGIVYDEPPRKSLDHLEKTVLRVLNRLLEGNDRT